MSLLWLSSFLSVSTLLTFSSTIFPLPANIFFIKSFYYSLQLLAPSGTSPLRWLWLSGISFSFVLDNYSYYDGYVGDFVDTKALSPVIFYFIIISSSWFSIASFIVMPVLFRLFLLPELSHSSSITKSSC